MTRSNNDNQNFESGEISLRDLFFKVKELWSYLLSKWIIIFSLAVFVSIAAFFYANFQKTVYKAELSFVLQDEKSGSGLSGAMGIASQFGIDVGGGAGGEFSGDNLLELMKSRSMIEKALLTTVNINNENKTLVEMYIGFNKFRDFWKGKPEEKIFFLPGADRTKFSLIQDSILGVFHKNIIAKNLSVNKVDKKLSIITIKVTSTNEIFSKSFAEVVAKVVSDFYIQTKTKREAQNVVILQRQTDSVRRELNEAISGVASSIDAAPNANPAFQSLRVPSQRRQVDVKANEAILTELVKNLQMSKMLLLKETPLIQVIDRPIFPLEKERISKLKAVILGGFLGVLMAVFLLLFIKFFKKYTQE